MIIIKWVGRLITQVLITAQNGENMIFDRLFAFFIAYSEKISSLVVYLPFVWALLFTKDWFSVVSYYRFYGINRLYKVELKQLLNLRYVVTLFISTICFLFFVLILFDMESLVLMILYMIPIGALFFWLRAIYLSRYYESNNSDHTVEQYRLVIDNKISMLDCFLYTAIPLTIAIFGSQATHGYISWTNSSDINYSIYFSLLFCALCLFVDYVLKKLVFTKSRPPYLGYLLRSNRNIVKDLRSNFFDLHGDFNIIEFNNTTYLMIYPFENENRSGSVAVRVILCQRQSSIIYAYLLPNDILYDVNINGLDQHPFYIDKVSRMGLDGIARSRDASMNDMGEIELLKPIFYADQMENYWANGKWDKLEYSDIPCSIKDEYKHN